MEAELPQDTPARPGHGPQSGELAKWQRAEEDGCGQWALAEAPGTPAVGRRGCGSQSGRCIWGRARGRGTRAFDLKTRSRAAARAGRMAGRASRVRTVRPSRCCGPTWPSTRPSGEGNSEGLIRVEGGSSGRVLIG